MLAKFKNSALSTLSSNINSSQLTITVSDASVFPIINSVDEYFMIVVSSNSSTYEIMKVTGMSGNNFVVVRGQENTTALSFNSGAVVNNRLTSEVLNNLDTEIVNTVTKTILSGFSRSFFFS